MEYITDKYALKEIRYYIELAIQEAKKSECLKVQRGAVLVQHGAIAGRGYNKPTIDGLCCLRKDIRGGISSEMCAAVHAEQMAMLDALNNKWDITGSKLYHIKLKNGIAVPSGKPSCTLCSRLMAEEKIGKIILLHKEGFASYSSEEFNRLSFRHLLKNHQSE